MYIQICKKKKHWIKSFFKINVMYVHYYYKSRCDHCWAKVMVFNATFNNIAVISWWLVLLEETGVPGEIHWQTLSHNVVSSTPGMKGIQTHNPVVAIGTDCIGSNNSNYYTIMTTMAPQYCWEKFRPCIHFINEHAYL